MIPYFERWMVHFPTIEDLAGVPLQEVLTLWEGLGYYSRARNLHQAAREMVAKYGGELPDNVTALQTLPGIGEYTAFAIASIAFNVKVVPLDGNIRRILARLFDLDIPVRATPGMKVLRNLADMNLLSNQPGDMVQGLMDLGETVCIPGKPHCDRCPLRGDCLSFQRGTQTQRPVLQPKKQIPHYLVTAAVINRRGKVLLAQRPMDGLLGGMWEFPGGKALPGESLDECLQREIQEELGVEIKVAEPCGVYHHAFTHFRITLHAFYCKIITGIPDTLQVAALKWVSIQDLKDFPMGKVDRLISLKLASDGDKISG